MEFTIKLKKYRDPSNGNWATDLTGGYENIRGKAYDFFKYAEGDRVLDKNGVEIEPPQYTSSGYWGAKAELTGLIKGFKNPVTQAEVNIEKIEDSFEATQEWGKQIPGEQYYLYVAMSAAESLEYKYKKEFGVEIKLDVIKVPVKKNDEQPKEKPKEIPAKAGKADATAKYVSVQNSADGTPTKITYDMIRDGISVFKVESSPIFEYDKQTKKITIKAKDVFYEADALDGQLWTWNVKYGKDAFVSMESVLVLQGYPQDAAKEAEEAKAAEEKKAKAPVEMTFDVREENIFFSQTLQSLYIIGKGKIPKEKLDAPVTDIGEEEDEYIEENFFGDGENLLEFEPAETLFIEKETAANTDFSNATIESKSSIGGSADAASNSDGTVDRLLASSPVTTESEAGKYKDSMVPPSFNSTPIYCQNYDPRWNKKPYDRGGQCGDRSTVGSSGCGPTSMSMLVNHWAIKGKSKFTSPHDMAKLFEKSGCRVCGRGSAINGEKIKKALKEIFGLVLETNVGAAKVEKYIKAGYPCVISGKNYKGYNILGNLASTHYAFGHFVCLTGVDSQGRIRVNDPGRASNSATAKSPNAGAITHFPAGKGLSSCLSLTQTIVVYPVNDSTGANIA